MKIAQVRKPRYYINAAETEDDINSENNLSDAVTFTFTQQKLKFFLSRGQKHDVPTFIFHSGCNHHVVTDKSLVLYYKEYKSTVRIADDTNLTVTEIGRLSLWNKSSSVFHVLKLTLNLIFVKS